MTTKPLSYSNVDSTILFTVCSAINARYSAEPGHVGLPWVTPPEMTDTQLVAEIAKELDYAADDVEAVIKLFRQYRDLI